MATFWDAGFLQYLAPVLVFILIFVIIFAILQKTKLLGGIQKLDFIIALVVSLLTLISENAVNFITTLSVWYILVAVIVILMALTIGSGMTEPFTKMPIGPGVLLYVGIAVLIIVISTVFGPVFTPYAEGAGENWDALRTIFHPKIFGMVLIFLVAMILIKKVTAD